MARRVDFWFDYTCPYAYLASVQVEALCARTGDRLVWRPMLLGGVFRAHGTPQKLFATVSPQKAAHTARDLARQAEALGVPLRFPEGHPLRAVEALRVTLAADCDPRVIHGFYRAYWADGRDIADDETLAAVLSEAGYSPETTAALVHRAHDDAALKDALRAATDEAIAHGIFGAPSLVVDGAAMYWGNDRLPLLEARPHPTKATPTMAHTLEVYFDFSSPYAYLGQTQAEALAARTGATLVWRPMLLGGLFKSIGQEQVPMRTWSEAKQRHTLADMQRWAEYWEVPFQFPGIFPINSVKALRAWIALPPEARDDFRARAFRAYWAEGRDISDDAVLRDLLGPRADATLAAINDPAVKQQLIDATTRAAEAGVFGAPTWVVDGTELFWGQDRLPLVERALSR